MFKEGWIRKDKFVKEGHFIIRWNKKIKRWIGITSNKIKWKQPFNGWGKKKDETRNIVTYLQTERDLKLLWVFDSWT